MTHDDLLEELNEHRENQGDMELELKRLTSCYIYASADDKRVVWAVLNKYVPFLTAEGLN